MYCTVIIERNIKKVREILKKSFIAEIRMDICGFTDEELLGLLSESKIPIIVTYRKTEKVSDTKRKDTLTLAAENGVDYIDLDIETDRDFLEEIQKSVKKNEVKLILSYHNYRHTPDEKFLRKIIHDSLQKHADLVKVCCASRTLEDNNRILSLYKICPDKLIAFAMGKIGKPTRKRMLTLGSPFTYVASSKDQKTDEGQFVMNEAC